MRVLLTGGTGFVGHEVARQLLVNPRVTSLRMLARTRAAAMPFEADQRVHVVEGDLTVPETLRGVARGVDVAIHAASYVGRDLQTARAVNVTGTARLLDECRGRGTHPIYLSTTAVYGPGPHRDLDEKAAELAPESGISETRASAEALVLAAGGTVLRAALTYGRGDRWVVPSAVAGTQEAGGWVGHGSALLSTIHIHDLAYAVAALAARSSPAPEDVFHLASTPPVRFKDMVSIVASELGISLPYGNVDPHDQALARFPATLLKRAYLDHWYSSELFARTTGIQLSKRFLLTPADVAWYAKLLLS